MNYGRLIIIGASSGIGLAVAGHLRDACTELITVSRRDPGLGRWIKTNLTKSDDLDQLVRQLGDQPIDGLLYLGGTWETDAFTPAYAFERCSDADIENVIHVNLTAAIKLIRRLLPLLKKAERPKIIVIGAAVGGLNSYPSREVANTASKFGLRGLVFSLRPALQPHGIGITLINPGNVATPEVLSDLRTAGKDETYAIPLADLYAIITCILSLSGRTNVNEIDLPSMR